MDVLLLKTLLYKKPKRTAQASPSLLGVRGDTVDILITWLAGRRGKNVETTLTLLERKVAKLRQPMVDAQKPSWYI